MKRTAIARKTATNVSALLTTLLILLLAAALPYSAHARTHTVCAAITCDNATIHAALDDDVNILAGNTIQVDDAIHTESNIAVIETDSDDNGIDDGYDTVHVPPFVVTNITGTNAPMQDTDTDGIFDWRGTGDSGDGLLTASEVPGFDAPDLARPNYLDAANALALIDADLRLDMFVDDELPFVGNTVIFTVSVVNDGPDATNGVQVSAPVPPGLKDASALASQGTFALGTGLWDIGTLNNGDSVAVEITVDVAGSAAIAYSAEIIASSQGDPDSTPANDVPAEDDQDRVTIIPQEQETFWTPANTVVGTTTSLSFINSLPKAGAALSGTLFAGADGGGVHRSTDAGENWFPVANDIEGTNVRGLASGNDDVLWAVLYGDGVRGGAWRSDDAASSFTQEFANSIAATQKDSLLSVAINTANEENAPGDGDVFLGSDQYGVFVSIDDGTSWTRIGSAGSNPLPSNARVIRSIDIEEEGAGAGLDRVYIGTHGRGVWRVDYSAGPTAPTASSGWVEANGTSGELGSAVVNDVHVDQGTGRVWAATDLGVWYTDDNGSTWTQSLRDETYLTMNGDPLEVTVTGRSVITYECQGDDYVLAGTDGDFVWRSDDAGATWTRFTGLMSVDNTVSGLRDGTILTLAYLGTPVDGFVYAGTQDQAVHRSDDCGETWNQVSKAEIAAIIQDLVFDNSGTVERLYAGTFGYGALVSSEFDASSTLTWTRINRGLTNHLVYAMERIPNPGGSNDVILAGTWGGGVFRTVNGGENWFHMGLPNRVIYDLMYNSGNGFLYATMDRGQVARSIDRGITWQLIGVATNALWSIIADGNDPNTIYVGTFGAGVFKSDNAGLNFDETNLQIGHIFDFAWGPNPETGNDAIFAATSIGVKYTEDGGSTWHDFNDGLTVTDVRTIVFAGTHLLCGTWGGGAYVYDDGANSWVRDGLPATNLVAFVINPDTGDLYATSGEGGLFKKHIPGSKVVTDTEDPIKNELPVEYALGQNYPNPFNPTTQIEFALPQAGDVRIAVYDAVGRQVEVLVNGSMPAGRHAVGFEAGHLSSGVYFYRLETRDKIMTQKMVLMK